MTIVQVLLLLVAGAVYGSLGASSVAIVRVGVRKGGMTIQPRTWRFVVRLVLIAWPIFWALIVVFGLRMLLTYLDEVPTPTIEVKK